MPLYEYQCKKCKHKFEKIQKFSDPPIKKCPECGAPVEKILHAPAVQFKGSGWYATDYAGKKDTSSDAPKPDGPKSDGAGDKNETKAAGKDKDAGKDKEKDSKPKKSEAKKSKD